MHDESAHALFTANRNAFLMRRCRLHYRHDEAGCLVMRVMGHSPADPMLQGGAECPLVAAQ